MEIKEFVKKTLLDLNQACVEASEEAGAGVDGYVIDSKGIHEGAIEFDMAVEVVTSEATKVGGGGNIRAARADLDHEEGTASSSVSRIKFVVLQKRSHEPASVY